MKGEHTNLRQAEADMAADGVTDNPAVRLALLALGWVAVALAVLGVFLPVLPTTPFLLVAAWAFSKSSLGMRTWLYEHPRFGQFLRDWRTDGAIPLRGKIAAAVGMLAAWHVVYLTAEKRWVPVAVGACLVCVATYVLTRPAPKPRTNARD